VLPLSVASNGVRVVHSSSFVDCMNASIGEGVRTKANGWSALDPVVSSTICTTLLASSISSNPMDWMQMCKENHNILSTECKNMDGQRPDVSHSRDKIGARR